MRDLDPPRPGGGAAWRRRACLLAPLLLAARPTGAIPPPPARPAQALQLPVNGAELLQHDTARPYQPVTWLLAARTGDRLLLRLDDATHTLVLALEAPGGRALFDGVVPGPDGLTVWLVRSGVYRLSVAVSADAARSAQVAPFTLGLRLLRDAALSPPAR